MAIFAQLQPENAAGSRRRRQRRSLRLDVTGFGPRDEAFEARVHDLSSEGLLLETDAPFKVGDRFALDTPHTGAVDAQVMWTGGRFFGCALLQPLTAAGVSAAILKSAPGVPADALAPGRAISPAIAPVGGLSVGARALAIAALAIAAWAPIFLLGQAILN